MTDYRVTWAGQDVTSSIQFYRDSKSSLHSRINVTNTPASSGGGASIQPIVFSSTLGQGAGTGAGHSGRSSQLTFFTTLGPAATALGAGAALPPVTLNLYSAQQSDSIPATLSNPNYIYAVGSAGSVVFDTSLAWSGSSSLKVTTDGSFTYQEISVNIGAQNFSPGAVYTLSFYLHALAGQAPSLRVFWEGNDTIAGNNAIGPVSTTIPSSSGWTRYILPVTMPNPIPYSYIGLRIDTGNTSEAVTFWLDGLQIEQYSTATPWHLGGTYTPAQLVRQGEVILYDPSGNKLFGGYAGKLSDATIAKQNYTQVQCYDYWQSLRRININEILDGISDIAAIQYLIATYAPWVDLSLLPTFPSGTLLGRVWRNKTLQWALQSIADMTGNQIYINPNKQMIYVRPTNAQAAPFSLSDTPDYRLSYAHVVDEYAIDDNSIINRVTFYGGKKPTPDFTQDISTQANGSNTTFVLAYYPRKSSNGKVQVLVGGVQQTVGYTLGTGAANTLISQGGSAQVLVDADARTLTFNTAPGTGVSVSCVYRYQIPLIIEVSQQDSYNFYGQWYDGTISDETVVDSTTAVQRCRVVLLEQAYGQTTLRARCYQSGIQAGQQLQVTNTLKGINTTFIVQQVTGAPLAPGVWEFSLTLGAWNWNLVDVLMQLAQRTNGSDITQQENTTPTQVNVATSVSSSIAVTVTPLTRAMANYWPGPSGTGNMYSGLSSI